MVFRICLSVSVENRLNLFIHAPGALLAKLPGPTGECLLAVLARTAREPGNIQAIE